MKCSKCNDDFPECEIQDSHDVPKYMGGADLDGRHWTCKKHHDIYEKMAFSVAFKFMPEHLIPLVHEALKKFARRFYQEDDTKTTTKLRL